MQRNVWINVLPQNLVQKPFVWYIIYHCALYMPNEKAILKFEVIYTIMYIIGNNQN